MRTLICLGSKPWGILAPVLMMVLLLATACGSAAQPDAQPADTSADTQPITEPTAAPVSDAQPTSPLASAEMEVHPGKLTWMVGGWGSANFDYTYDVGGANTTCGFSPHFWWRPMKKPS
jgi:hypothetical protein